MAISKQTLSLLKRVINASNKQLKKHEGMYGLISEPTSLEQELDYIQGQEGRAKERIRALRKMLPSYNPDAWKTVRFGGMSAPSWYRTEVNNIRRQINKERAAIRAKLFPDYETLNTIQKLTIQSGKNINDVTNEDIIGEGGDLKAGLKILYPNELEYAERYISVWEDNNGSDAISNMIREIAINDPERFKLIHESPDLAKDIEYIYPDYPTKVKKKHWTYDRKSAFIDTMNTRYNNATKWWAKRYKEYKQGIPFGELDRENKD